jgi:hypothetical protein
LLNIAGTTGAHELTHRILGVDDLAFDANDPELRGLMSIDHNKNFDKEFLTPGVPPALQLTPGQIAKLFERCKKKHHGGGGHGGGGFWPFGVFVVCYYGDDNRIDHCEIIP